MARGRMVSAQISTDRRFNKLSERSALLFLMTIPQLDRDGLILIGEDAALLWARVCPLRGNLRELMMELIGEWEHMVDSVTGWGLAVVYATPDGPALWFPGFPKNQALRYDREASSVLPPPPGILRTRVGLLASPNGHVVTDLEVKPEVKPEVEPEVKPEVKPAPANDKPKSERSRKVSTKEPPCASELTTDHNYQPLYTALLECLRVDPKLQGGRVGKLASALRKAGYLASDIEIFTAWWHSCFWRGRKGEAPGYEDVSVKIRQAQAWDRGGRKVPADVASPFTASPVRSGGARAALEQRLQQEASDGYA